VPKDRRSVFVVPWEGATFVGTTDTDHAGPLDEPVCTAADVEYLLRAVNAALDTNVSPADVIGTWAGLRPLLVGTHPGSGDRTSPSEEATIAPEAAVAGATAVAAVAGAAATATQALGGRRRRTADLSRAHRVDVSPSGVVTVTGGKLTTYRRMAADAVDAIVERLDEPARLRIRRRCPTKRLRLRGADGFAETRDRGDGAWPGPAEVTRHLADRYGGEARVLLAMLTRDPALAEPMVRGLPYLRVEAVYASRYEMAITVDDVLSRRTRALLLAAERTAAAAEEVAALLAPELGWSPEVAAQEAASFRDQVERARRARRDLAPATAEGTAGPAAPDGQGPDAEGPDGEEARAPIS
jgi:glycerol-3-phosphate dehydrogenase